MWQHAGFEVPKDLEQLNSRNDRDKRVFFVLIASFSQNWSYLPWPFLTDTSFKCRLFREAVFAVHPINKIVTSPSLPHLPCCLSLKWCPPKCSPWAGASLQTVTR